MVNSHPGAAARPAALFLTVAIALMLLVPVPRFLLELTGEASSDWPVDKLVHAVLFGLLAYSWLASLTSPSRRAEALIVVAVIAYGALLEVAQPLVGPRSAEIADVGADSAGALTAWFWRRLRR